MNEEIDLCIQFDTGKSRPLPRTQYGLEHEFDYCKSHIDKNHIDRCLKLIKKTKEKRWNTSWFFECIMLPYEKQHNTSNELGS